jgi:hypothetical protein
MPLLLLPPPPLLPLLLPPPLPPLPLPLPPPLVFIIGSTGFHWFSLVVPDASDYADSV